MSDVTCDDIVEQMRGDNPPALIAVKNITEHEDGGATYEFVMDDRSQKILIEEGIKLVLYCAAFKVDLGDVYDWIEAQAPKEDAACSQ